MREMRLIMTQTKRGPTFKMVNVPAGSAAASQQAGPSNYEPPSPPDLDPMNNVNLGTVIQLEPPSKRAKAPGSVSSRVHF